LASDPLSPGCTIMSGLDEKSVPSYGSLSLDELGRDVREAQIGHRDDFAFDPSYFKGHQMVGSINFNSLNRIVSKYATAASATPADVGELVERLRKELAEEQEIWPKWAAEICKCLRGYGVDPGDGEGWDLPAQFEDWVRGVVENETARAESAEAEVARLESDLSRANHALETALSEHAEIRDALTVEVARLRKVVERAKALIAKNWTGYCWHMVTDADADEVRQFAEEVNRALQTKEKTNG
jgi:hypothetical protein